MKNNRRKFFLLIACALLFLFVTACGCGGETLTTYTSAKDQLISKQSEAIKSRVRDYLATKDVSNEEITNKLAQVSLNFDATNTDKVLEDAIKDATSEEELASQVQLMKNSIVDELKEQAKLLLTGFYNVEKLKRHQVEYCKLKVENTTLALDAIVDATTKDVDEKNVVDSTNLYQVMSNHYLKINEARAKQGPIRVYSFKEDGFWSALFNNVLVFPIGWVLQIVSRGFGGSYFVGILIVTLVIRLLMMPVYNSTNDMQLKQQLANPEMKKLEEKYALRKDPESQRAKQMEQAQIYKRYKMGLGGCLPMLFQLPVFIAVYNAVSRMYLTDGSILGSPNWVGKLNSMLFGIDLFKTRGSADKWQFWGIIIILVLVVGTQIFQQIMTQKIQKWTYAKSQEDIPAYKRQAYQQNQQGNSMKFMMYFMIAMMGLFVFQSAAALGIYWLIGNIFAIVQMFVNYKLAPKRLAKLKKKLHVEE